MLLRRTKNCLGKKLLKVHSNLSVSIRREVLVWKSLEPWDASVYSLDRNLFTEPGSGGLMLLGREKGTNISDRTII